MSVVGPSSTARSYYEQEIGVPRSKHVHGGYHKRYVAIPARVGMAMPPRLTFSLPALRQPHISGSYRCGV